MSGYIGTKSVTLSTTSATVGGSSTVGAGLTVDNDGATVLTVDRATSDGTIIDVQKDGTSVGGIGVSASDDFYIGASTANHAGVYFGTDIVYPMRANSLSDGVTSIGHSSNRFNNLYLSGGVYLGGTGAANKLSDYEEGTWTPTFSSSSFATGITVNNAHYVKIGDLVNVTAAIGFTGTTGNYTVGDNYQLGGLPFSMSDTHGRNGSGWASASSNRVGFNNLAQLTYIAGNVTSVYGTLARTYAVTITITYKISAT